VVGVPVGNTFMAVRFMNKEGKVWSSCPGDTTAVCTPDFFYFQAESSEKIIGNKHMRPALPLPVDKRIRS